MNHFISVIIPAYNEEKLIGRCVDALKKQDYPKDEYEIIVVDHRSTDKTSEVAREHGARVLRYSEDKATIGATRQYGLEQAKGEIIAFVDADTIAATDWLSKINEHMQDDSVVCVFGIGILDTRKRSAFLMTTFYDIFQQINQFFGKALPSGFNMAVKRNALGKIGGFNRELRTCEDLDLAIRLQKKFGKRSVMYHRNIRVITSSRRFDRLSSFIPYVFSSFINYINFVLLDKKIAAKYIPQSH